MWPTERPNRVLEAMVVKIRDMQYARARSRATITAAGGFFYFPSRWKKVYIIRSTINRYDLIDVTN